MTYETTPKKNWLVTGASSGFGQAIVSKVLEADERVIATFRSQKEVAKFNETHDNDKAFAVLIDVTNTDQIALAVQQALEKFGHIDVLVNNAGYGVFGTVEETDKESIKQQFDVNFFGAINMIKAVLPSMRSQKMGHIINISSKAGLLGRAGMGIYCASKFALEGMSESLAEELEPFGIKVTLVEPGAFKTKFFDKSTLSEMDCEIDDYKELHQEVEEWAKELKGRKDIGDPDKLADAIVNQIATLATPPLRILMGATPIDGVVDALQNKIKELEQWRSLSSSMSLNNNQDDLDSVA